MSASQPASALHAVPPSIIRRPSPSASPLTSSHFTSPSAGGASTTTTTPTTPILSPSATGAPSSILLNRPKPPEGALASPPSETSIDAALNSGTGLVVQGVGSGSHVARVNSPDGTASDTSAGAFSDTNNSTTTVTAPSSAVSSPGLKPVAQLGGTSAVEGAAQAMSSGQQHGGATSANIAAASAVQGDYFRPSRSPSPHCHFAPLPKVDQDRPMTRRNSNAQGSSTSNRVKPFVGKGDGAAASDTPDEPFQMEMGEQLGSALHNLSLHGRNSPSLGRRRASRSSSAARSTSPSPVRRPGMSHSSSQTHSPAMSRHASSDAMNVHYIQGTKVGATSPVPGPANTGPSARERDESSSRERERHESERERELQIEMARIKEREAWKEEREAAARATGAISPPDPAAKGSTTPNLEQTEVGAPVAQTARKPMFVEPSPAERVKLVRKNTNEEVVEIEPGQEANAAETELEEVEEEDEEDVEDEDGDEDEKDDDDGEEDEHRKDGDEDDDDEEEDEEDVETEVRATARGAAVEVVHWHRSESPEAE